MLNRLFLLLWMLLAAPALAESAATLPHTTVELVSETVTPAPGSRITIGLVLTPAKGWHTYYEHPGDTGMPPVARWSLPQGAQISPFRFPVPETFVVAGLMNHVYSGRNVLLAEVQVPDDARGAFPIRARLDWLVCDDRLCVPEQAELTLPLRIGDGALDPLQKAVFENARQALPHRLSETAHFERNGEQIRIAVPFAEPASVTDAHFFAGRDDAIVFAAPQTITRTDDSIIIETRAVDGTTVEQLPGLLRLVRGTSDVLGLQLTASPGAVPLGQPLAAARAATLPAFSAAFGFAILGGVLLNLMPCVFPILSLKALSVAKSGHSARAARTEAVAYTLGVLAVTLLLGFAAILIARAGQGAGWAFQLQDPRVIAFLMLLTFAIGLNFAGLFEVDFRTANLGQGLASRPGAGGAFFTGALAAFVATPCTGPFMAGALGAALLLPPALGLAVFAGLGLGLALPFLAIGFVPPLRRMLPRPGSWMQTFRHILAVPMLVTALGLAWVLGRQTGSDQLVLALAAALALALALWVAGNLQKRARRSLAVLLGAGLIAILSPFAIGNLPAGAATATTSTAPLAALSQPFTPQALQQARTARQPVLLYFTADWCLTCKVNEKGALADPRVAESFRNKGIQVMVGDWTKPDAIIARFLENHGRAGIPLYLFYAANGEIRELPQLLTVKTLTDLAS